MDTKNWFSRFRVFALFLLAGLWTVEGYSQADLPAPGRYMIVAEQSRIQVKTGSGGAFGFLGHSHIISPKSFTGVVEVKTEGNNAGSVSIQINASSLYEAADFKPEDKKKIETQLHGEVLETAKHPEISFQSSSASFTKGDGKSYNVKIEGDLNLHGVKRKITVPAKVTKDGSNLRASGQFEILRKDYNVETPDAGGGTVKVSNKLEISFDLMLKQ